MTLAMGMRAETHGGCPTMSVGTRQILQVAEPPQKKINLNVDRHPSIAVLENATPAIGSACTMPKPRVFVAAENRLLREALSRMLVKNGEIEVVGMDLAEPFRAEDLLLEETDILLMYSRGNRNEDLTSVRAVRTIAPKVQILLIGVTGEEAEFLQCVRRRSSRLSSQRRFRRGRGGRRTRASKRQSHLPRDTLRIALPLHGARSDFLPFRKRSPATRIDAARAATNPAHRRGPHQQRNR
jgi:hypothetical protein